MASKNTSSFFESRACRDISYKADVPTDINFKPWNDISYKANGPTGNYLKHTTCNAIAFKYTFTAFECRASNDISYRTNVFKFINLKLITFKAMASKANGLTGIYLKHTT
ncbi:hypothetical protein HUJ05_012098 [Dendroctonus ponderosae]|nr:hypothetical protein HUJ05_012098 [Dendroctonus ponderosae]